MLRTVKMPNLKILIWVIHPDIAMLTYMSALDILVLIHLTATSFILPHQNLAKSSNLSSGTKDPKPFKYINIKHIHLALDNDFYLGV